MRLRATRDMKQQHTGAWDDVVRFLDTPSNFLVVAVVLSGLWAFALTLGTAEQINDALSALGILIGGFWVLYQFVLRRAFESALAVDVVVTSRPQLPGSHHVVFIDVHLSNVGNRRIVAPKQLTSEQVADYEDTVHYPGDLQVFSLKHSSDATFNGWFYALRRGMLTSLPNIPAHIHLLYEYTRQNREADFFMEPGESYKLGNVLILPIGHYVAKVVFVGSRASASEFWSRVIHFRVPVEVTPTGETQKSGLPAEQKAVG